MDYEKIDGTIDAICDWIQNKLNSGLDVKIPEMTSALANLVTARANATSFEFRS